MFKRLIILVIILFVCFPVSAQAQQVVSFSEAEVDLWPEFDQPSVLVIYRLKISSSVTLPVDLKLRIPATSGAPNAVAASLPDGLVNIPYSREVSGDWTVLSFQATTADLQIEYYDPGLVKSGSARHFVYSWLGDYAVDSLTMQVQQPVGAKDMLISPSLGSGQTAPDGLIYYTSTIGSLKAGQGFSISVDYLKDDDTLSAQSIPIAPSGPLNQVSSGSATLLSILPWILGAVGILLLGGGGYWYWQSGRNKGVDKPFRPRHKPAEQVTNGVPEGAEIYCHQCGKRASTGDRFCRACGTQLRIEK